MQQLFKMRVIMSKGKTIKLSLMLCLMFALSLCIHSSPLCGDSPKKIGILLLHQGTSDTYEPDWVPQYFNFLFDVFDPGFFAGGPLEGKTCYSFIHYADEAEATICNVEPGTPIDIFCNQYTGSYPIHSMIDHYSDNDGNGIPDFEDDCFAPGIPVPWAPLTFGHSTVDPISGETIYGPHVDDPAGPGIGIADFLEMEEFSLMERYPRLPEGKLPYREQVLKWWFGNDTPGYPPDDPELLNVKDRLQELLPEYNFVFRYGWDTYAKNVDAYGNSKYWAYSIETAIDELINGEKVDKIIVSYADTFYNNLKYLGHEWYDADDQGVSAIPGKTYKECVEDITDGVGPATAEDLNTFLVNKPWEKHWEHPLPLVQYLAEKIKPTIDLRYTRGFGDFEEYELAVLDMLIYTITKYNIPEDTSLKVIVAHHGYHSAYMGAAACDCYFRMADDLTSRITKRIKDDLTWPGKFEVVVAPFKFSEGSTFDPPTQDEPFGKVLSVGEIIDASINGAYVNALGETVDNGINNFETIIVLHGYYFTDDFDSGLYLSREEALGNNIYSQGSYARDRLDADATKYNSDDIDDEAFTVKVCDGTGWASIPGCIQDETNCTSNPTVYKGSAEHPTKIIMCGTILGNASGIGREKLTEAAAKAITEAIQESDCPVTVALGGDARANDLNVLRNFRDEVLSKTRAGQDLIRLYYEWSPAIVKAIKEDEEFKEHVKEMIDEILMLIEAGTE
jgi:hypothetical protein